MQKNVSDLLAVQSVRQVLLAVFAEDFSHSCFGPFQESCEGFCQKLVARIRIGTGGRGHEGEVRTSVRIHKERISML